MDANPAATDREPAEAAGRARHFVTTFARGPAVLEAFGPGNKAMTLAEVAGQTGLDCAVARRLLLTLVDLDFARVHERRFELTARVLRLAHSFLLSAGLGASLQPFLDALARSVDETVSLAVLDGPEVVFVARSDVPGRRLSTVVGAGLRLPAFTAASGRVLLGHQPRREVERLLDRTQIVRQTRRTAMNKGALLAAVHRAGTDGYSVNYEEVEDGLVSVSVPVMNRAGLVVAALNVSTASVRTNEARLHARLLPRLRAGADELSSMLP